MYKKRLRFQIHCTELNPAFWHWFGDSKVTENGVPKVVYHGTWQQFTKFEPSTIGSRFGYDKIGFFFTDSLRQARNYAFKPEEDNRAFRMSEVGRQLAEKRVIAAYLRISKPMTVADVTKHKDYHSASYHDPIDFYDSNRKVVSDLAKHHDGVIFKVQGQILYAVFKPTQIKAVTNRGTWNDDPDIYR